MYIIVSWDIGTGEPMWSQINQRLFRCIELYPNVRPVNTFYLVRVNNEAQRQEINNCLKSIADSVGVNVYFVVSPLLNQHGWFGSVEGTDISNRVNQVTG